MSSKAFNYIVSNSKDLRNRVFQHRSERFDWCKTLDSIIPTMRSKDSINISKSINFNIFSTSIDINTVVVLNKTKIHERQFCFAWQLKFSTNDCLDLFGNRLIISSQNKVVYLPEEKYLLSFVSGLIDAVIMDSSFEVKFFGAKNLIDMMFINLPLSG